MGFDPATFALEIINFLVLLWLLQRLLFRPVQAAIDARAQEQARAAAQALERQQALEAREQALAAREREALARRDLAEHVLQAQVAAEREKRLAELAQSLEAQRERSRARLEQELRGAREAMEQGLRARASAFVAEYLQRLAGPAVETAVIRLFLADLLARPGDAQAAWRVDGPRPGGAPACIDLATAFEPEPEVRGQVEAALVAALEQAVSVEWRRDPQLLAGIRVHLPGHLLEASLQAGVDAFAGQAPAP